MDAGDLAARAATFDELLSEDFEPLLGQDDAEKAAKRVAAWCQSSAGGNWELFERRLERDHHTVAGISARFASALRRRTRLPEWVLDADWIQAALHGDSGRTSTLRNAPFEHVLAPLVDEAERRLWAAIDAPVAGRFTGTAREDLRALLIDRLCDLCAPALYERFARSDAGYAGFVAAMATGGLIDLFDEKPVLLRLIATVTRQWLTATGEFVERVQDDIDRIGNDILRHSVRGRVDRVHGGLSDQHRGGRSVLRVTFEDGARVMYKPKDLRLDVAWHSLVSRLNSSAPVELRAAAAVARNGYGWAEHIEHSVCATEAGAALYFRRAGAWLALFHCFAASDIHHENMIAAGSHPVPIDVETLLQPVAAQAGGAPTEAQAHHAARELIADSVAAVGLLPAYGKSAAGIYVAGGVASRWPTGQTLIWTDVNTDTMRPSMARQSAGPTTNLPRIGADRHVGLAQHLEEFVAGFREYATYLHRSGESLCDGFVGTEVRTVNRPTQYYSMLLQRMKDDRAMADGVVWSAQADFTARLADWDRDADNRWPTQRAERAALLELNVPLFTTSGDAGVRRARARIRDLDQNRVAWQVEVIRQTSPDLPGHDAGAESPLPTADSVVEMPDSAFMGESDAVAGQIADYSIRKGPGAAWVGLGWFPDSDVSQLAVLGHDFYNGACGIATFLAAHAKVAGRGDSADLALAAVVRLRAELRGGNAVRIGRVLGLGGATGLGSIVYGLSCMADLLGDEALLADAHGAAGLLTDDLIASDTQFDVIGGSAGAILGLLRLYRDTHDEQVLDRALACGTHLLTQQRHGPVGRRSWPCRVSNDQMLNGMSHGAAGFAYSLAALAAASGRDEFAEAARECLAFERANFDALRSDWHDRRMTEPHWRSQWCHGAVGIGLARLAMASLGTGWSDEVTSDVDRALAGAARGWPGHADTLCCGALGSVELAREAGKVRRSDDLRRLAAQRLSAILGAKAGAGAYRWSAPVSSPFNVGLFRGLAGVGYTCLREIDQTLPNVLIWE